MKLNHPIIDSPPTQSRSAARGTAQPAGALAKLGDFFTRQLAVGAPEAPHPGQPRVGLMKGSPTQYALLLPYAAMTGLAAASAASGAAGTGSLWKIPAALGLARLGLMAADATSALMHWGPDNYFTAKTPVMGPFVKTFLEHHEPKTMRVGSNASIPWLTVPFLGVGVAALLPALATGRKNWALMSFATAFALTPLGLVAHAESHKTAKEQTPTERKVVDGLRSAGLLIPAKAHLQEHHSAKKGHAGGYAVLTGECNAALDRLGVFRKLEMGIFAATKVMPRCWEDPLVGREVMEAALGKYPGLKAEAEKQLGTV